MGKGKKGKNPFAGRGDDPDQTLDFDEVIVTPESDTDPRPRPKRRMKPRPKKRPPVPKGAVDEQSMSRQDWGDASAQETGRSGEWSAQRIDDAPAVGPPELANETDSVRLQASSARLTPVRSEAGPQRITLKKRLGRGSVGRTLEGTYHDEIIVAKVVSSKFHKHPKILNQLKDRVRASMSLEHPRVVGALWTGDYKDRTMIIFEKVVGPTLKDILKAEGILSVEDATDRIRELVEVLQAAEAKGLAHGDIRPEKIFVDDSGTRLADFGLAEAACLGAGYGQIGLTFGHPTYQAPEVIQERLRAPTIRADIYSLGVLFYRLFSGVPPFQSRDPRKLLHLHLTKPVPPPPNVSVVPRRLATLVLRMTAKDPTRRPGLLDLLDDLY